LTTDDFVVYNFTHCQKIIDYSVLKPVIVDYYRLKAAIDDIVGSY
jgi:hypothetical protein